MTPITPKPCPTCGRRVSEREVVAQNTDADSDQILVRTRCYDPIHDAADYAAELVEALRDTVEPWDGTVAQATNSEPSYVRRARAILAAIDNPPASPRTTTG